jgi:hypothetical protein
MVGADTSLAGIAELERYQTSHHRIDIRIVEHDKSRVAAQLKRDFLDAVGALVQQQLADLGRSGKQNLAHRRMRGEGGTNPGGKPHSGTSFLLIDMKMLGLTARPAPSRNNDHHLNEAWFEEVKVSVSNLAGEENRGWTYTEFLLGHERATIAGVGMAKRESIWLAAAEKAVDIGPFGLADG